MPKKNTEIIIHTASLIIIGGISLATGSIALATATTLYDSAVSLVAIIFGAYIIYITLGIHRKKEEAV